MKDTYRTIHEYGYDEVIINKSKFIGYAKPICSEDEAIEFIDYIKSKHKDATHNVSAYVVGENSNIQRYSDDGEPSGTAGIPVLEVIKKENLRNVAVVVTRYYGGIKLGAGGLVRAYTKGAKIGLDVAKIVEKVLFTKLMIKIDYTLYGKVENELINLKYTIDEVIYDAAVNIVVLCQKDNIDTFQGLITESTSGRCEFVYLGEEHISIKDGKMIR